MRSRLTSSRFIGRIGELAELELAVREAAVGRPALVLLGGDSGVGKTRLVNELERRIAEDSSEPDGNGGPPGQPARDSESLRGALVLRGDGVEQRDGELPYAPLLSALRPLVRARHPSLAALSPGSRSQLATILPSLDDDADGDRREPAVSGTSDQLRLFEAALELIDCLSDPGPLVLILEDMHWADRSTRTFASFLARSLRQEHVCLILTYRTDELHRRHPLRPLLSELERLERARRIVLEPFDRDELAEALSDILGAEPDQALLRRLFMRSEGNPLYTEELLAAGLDGRGAAPQSLRDAFLGRIERLAPDTQRVARAVAVGRSLSENALAAVTELERPELQTALREAVAEQTLVLDPHGRSSFRHALLREALYDDLLPGERGELHLALARYLDGMVNRDPDRELERAAATASHYAAAGDQLSALRTSVVAALAAERAFAFGEAAELAEKALELWPRVSDPEQVTGMDHVELLARAADAHRIADERPRSVVLIGEALRELDPERDSVRYADLLGRLARITWALNRGEEAVEMAQRALSILGPDDVAVRPRLLAWLARSRFLRGRFRDAATDGELALQTAIDAGDRLAETEVLNTLGMARVSLQQVDEGVALLRRAIATASENDDLDSLATGYSNLADMLSVAGRTADALATAREGLERTPRSDRRGRNWLMLTLAEMAFEAGEWDAAREAMAPSPREWEGTLFIFRHLREAELALGVGDEESAERCLEAVCDEVGVATEPQWIGLFGALAGELAIRRRDLDDGRAKVQLALDRLELCTDDVMRIARVSAIGIEVEADQAQRARDLREPAERRGALTRARIHGDRLAAAALEGGPVERARLAQGRAELARARGRSGAREWSRAVAAWEEIGRPYPAAIARLRLAEDLAAAGNRAEASEAVRAALTVAGSLGSRWLSGELLALADRARLEVESNGARGRDDEPEAAAPADPFGLTARERQVLALLAEGATNRQIGAALFMAEKTASVHVSRILAKLGVQSRTQAAAVAHRLNLARAPEPR